MPEVAAADALGHLERLAVRMAGEVEPRAVVETCGLDDERVAVPAADGVAHPCRVRIGRHLAAVEKDLAIGEILEQEHDQRRRLNDLCQPAARDVTRATGLAAGNFWIVLAELLETAA